MDLAIGLAFGIVIQGINKFPEFGLVDKFKPAIKVNGELTREENPSYIKWAEQTNIWVSLAKNIFINGILLLTAPVVFIAIFRVVSRPGNKNVGRISFKGIALLLLNTAFAFAVTFWIGYALKIGAGSNLSLDNVADKKLPKETQPLPVIIWEYLPSNVITPWAGTMVISLIVMAALFGHSVKLLSKKKPEQMQKIRNFMDGAWTIVSSILTTFMKIMPLSCYVYDSFICDSKTYWCFSDNWKGIRCRIFRTNNFISIFNTIIINQPSKCSGLMKTLRKNFNSRFCNPVIKCNITNVYENFKRRCKTWW